MLRSTAAVMALAALTALGCTRFREVQSPDAGRDPAYCTYCHGAMNEDGPSPAPPPDTNGRVETTYRGVGAHAVHLQGSVVASPVPCGTCHHVPADADEAGHMDTPPPAEVAFSGIASAGGANPEVFVPVAEAGKADEAGEGEGEGKDGAAYDPTAKVTCRNVYCHGATLTGGKATEPVWNGTADEQAAFSQCDSCHGFPPPPPHAASTRCYKCHTDTVAEDGSIADTSLHVDGKVDVGEITACDACHGTDESPAPPPDLKGETETTAKGVGAHQSHLGAAHGISAAVECTECHEVPKSVDDQGHIDGDGRAEVVFGEKASSGGLEPAYDGDASTCANVYCHGATLDGGKVEQPQWTLVDGSQITCDSCHGTPPGTGKHSSVFEPHSFMGKNCTYCHEGLANKDATAIEDPARHVDGTKDVQPGGGQWDAESKTCSPVCHDPRQW